MHAQPALIGLLHQLDEMLQQLSPQDYRRPLAVLSNATIGQHCRHVIECFQEMEKGYAAGVINYDARRRDASLETDPQLARRAMAGVENSLAWTDKPVLLCAAVGDAIELHLPSSYYREIYHNLDHLVHHMALIRAALPGFPEVRVPESFGVAWATLRFRAGSIAKRINKTI
jgi:hypothetical protein